MDVEGDAGAMEVEHDVVAELGATHTLLQERAECSRRYLQQLIACSSAIIDAKRSGNPDGVSALVRLPLVLALSSLLTSTPTPTTIVLDARGRAPTVVLSLATN